MREGAILVLRARSSWEWTGGWVDVEGLVRVEGTVREGEGVEREHCGKQLAGPRTVEHGPGRLRPRGKGPRRASRNCVIATAVVAEVNSASSSPAGKPRIQTGALAHAKSVRKRHGRPAGATHVEGARALGTRPRAPECAEAHRTELFRRGPRGRCRRLGTGRRDTRLLL